MNKAIKYLALASAVVFGLASCVQKAPQYEPAEAVGNAEVFFSPTLPATYNLKGNEGSFPVTVNRVQNTGSLTVNLNSSAPSEFSVPANVTFDSGAKTASFNITFDPANLKEDVEYPFTITIANDVTPYGASEYSFTASIPAPWEVFKKGTLYETPYWGEIESKTLYYQEITSDILLCKFEDCFGHDTGPEYPVQDYLFYWNKTNNRIYIPVQWMGYENSNGLVWFSDEPAFYNLYWAMKNGAGYGAGKMGPGAGQVEGTPEWFEFCDAFRAAYPEDYYPYYDDNGGFYLSDQYIAGYPGDASVYLGRYVGDGNSDGYDMFIADGFVRIVNYNDDKHFGASSALYEGTMESLLFSSDGEPVEFEQSLRYDADYDFDPAKYNPAKDGVITTTYYLSDYFAEGQCLAFTAPIPELTEDGSEISDVENEQFTGTKLIGYDLYTKIKKGTITVPEVEEGEDAFPTYEITVAVYTKDEEGNVVHDFGNVKEIFTALEYGKDNYTLDDIGGAYKEDYLGDWVFFAKDYFDGGAEISYDGSIEDAGKDEEGNELLKITNLSGMNGVLGLVDEMYATWDDQYGLVWLYGQDLAPITYQGMELGVSVYPFDPDSEKNYGQSNCLIGGLTEDYVFALVNRYSGVNLAGLNYLVPDLEASLAIVYYIYGVPASGTSFKHVGFNNYAKLARAAQTAGRGVKVSDRQLGKRTAQKAAKSVVPARTINVSNCVKAEKNLGTLADAPLK